MEIADFAGRAVFILEVASGTMRAKVSAMRSSTSQLNTSA